ncbi:LytR C-terminal domain-containing protein [Nitrosomonas ureae]|uniref:Tetratricopeptide repeat-containing protein n=1 Tax=Nitrosomonas ureae TaxID=44577 RepID=A0A1H5RLI9_9PROT|nr:LytR C-terminal domain-containing protein [Nitrosomonas ureae]SEF39209.1 Tetratricopeptide repeat-containing protein [Nitrosomonas ureae]
MFKIKRLSWIVGCALALNGCAFMQKDTSMADIEIKPVMNIKHANGSPKIMYLLGRYYQGKIDYQKAIAAYERALEEKPDYVEVHNGLGVIYSIQGRHELSLQHFRTAIEYAPVETYLYNNLGYAYLIQGNTAEAVKSLEKAVLLDPDNKRAQLNLAVAQERINLGDKAAALQTDSIDPLPLVMQEVSNTNVNEVNDKAESLATSVPYRADDQVSHHNDSKSVDSTYLRLEISNGNGITGMAKQVSVFFQQHGVAKARLTNHQTYKHYQTEIYYRSGNYDQAYQINKMLPIQVKLVESNELRSDIQIKILLGQDFSREAAYFNKKELMQVSQNAKKSLKILNQSIN